MRVVCCCWGWGWEGCVDHVSFGLTGAHVADRGHRRSRRRAGGCRRHAWEAHGHGDNGEEVIDGYIYYILIYTHNVYDVYIHTIARRGSTQTRRLAV